MNEMMIDDASKHHILVGPLSILRLSVAVFVSKTGGVLNSHRNNLSSITFHVFGDPLFFAFPMQRASEVAKFRCNHRLIQNNLTTMLLHCSE